MSVVEELVSLGFERQWVEVALSLTNGNKNYAIEWLLSDEFKLAKAQAKKQNSQIELQEEASNKNKKQIENPPSVQECDVEVDIGGHDLKPERTLASIKGLNQLNNPNDNDSDTGSDDNNKMINKELSDLEETMKQNNINTWTCHSCGSEVNNNLKKCSVCDTEKPTETDWHCPTCSFVNEQDDMVCQMCLSQKPLSLKQIEPKSDISKLKRNDVTFTCESCQYHNTNTETCVNCGYKHNESNKNNESNPISPMKKDDENDDPFEIGLDDPFENIPSVLKHASAQSNGNIDEVMKQDDEKAEDNNDDDEKEANNNKSFVQGGVVDAAEKYDANDPDDNLPYKDPNWARISIQAKENIEIPEMDDVLVDLAKEEPKKEEPKKEEPKQQEQQKEEKILYPQPAPDEEEPMKYKKNNENTQKKKQKIKVKLRVGTPVDIYSAGRQDWIDGTIKEIKGDLICVVYGKHMKWVKKNSRQLRPKQQMVDKIINDEMFKQKEDKPPPQAFDFNNNVVAPSAPMQSFSEIALNNLHQESEEFKPPPPLFSPPGKKQVKYQPFDAKDHDSNKADQLGGPRKDEFDYDVTFTSSVLGLELYPDKDGNNCVVGRCLSKTSKKHVDPGSIIIKVNELPVAGLSYDMVRDAVKTASKIPPLTIKFRMKLSNVNKNEEIFGYAQPNDPNERGYLKIKVVAGVQLKHRASYCVVQVGSARLSTREVPRNEHPEWQEMLTFKNFRPDKGKTATVQVFDHSSILKDTLVGEVSFEVPTLFNKLRRDTLELKSPKKKKLAGVIILNSIIVHKTNTIKHLRKY